MIWISIEDIIALGMPRRTFYRCMDKFTTRLADKSANGKSRREILLSSLPAEIQTAYFQNVEAIHESPLRSQASVTAADAGLPLHEQAGAQSAGGSTSPACAATASFDAPSSSLSPPHKGGEGMGKRAIHESPLHRLTEEELENLNELAGALRAVRSGAGAMHESPLRGMSMTTIQRKIRALECYGLAGLMRQRRSDAGAARVADEEVIKAINRLYMKTYQPTIAWIHREISKKYIQSNEKPPSYSFVKRACDSIDPDLVKFFRKGEREYNDKCAWYAERERPPLPRQWVDGDHHPWDRPVIFRDGTIGRPWLSAVRDECTTEILGFSVNANQSAGKYANRRTIVYVLRRAILRKEDPRWPSSGLFEHFYCDLGKDYRSKYVRAVCGDLGIKNIYARGYHGQSKPIERWFRTMEDQLRHLPGYVGNKPENNPEAQRPGARRTWEEMRKDLMTIDQLEAALLDWILDVYHHADSRALKGVSPLAALDAHVKNGWSAREVRDERALDLLLMERLDRGKEPIIVHRGKIQAFGSKWEPRYFEAPELCELNEQAVQVFYDPDRIGELYIYKDARFVCIARNSQLWQWGAKKEDIERKLEIQRYEKRRRQERYQELVGQAQYGGDALKQSIAERNYKEAEAEEHRRIAASAGAGRTTTVILPQFQQAAKKIAALKKAEKAKVREIKIAPEAPPRLAEMIKPAPAIAEDEPPSWSELLKRMRGDDHDGDL